LLESVLIGIATMASIQSVRAIYPVRGLFHELYISRWLRPTVPEQLPMQPDELRKPLSKLLSLAVATDSRALFDLPAEQLLAQLGAAADIVVTYPVDHRGLLLVLAGEAGWKDTTNFIENFGKKFGADSSLPDPVYVDVRNRVAQHIQRRLDGLHISMGRQWRLILRLTAIAIATLFAFVASIPNAGTRREATVGRLSSERGAPLSHDAAAFESGTNSASATPQQPQTRTAAGEEGFLGAQPRTPTKLQRGLFVALTGLVAGFMASLSRDVVAILEKLRR
jgi:hypothetical protein